MQREIKTNRLGARALKIDSDWEADWKNTNQGKYSKNK